MIKIMEIKDQILGVVLVANKNEGTFNNEDDMLIESFMELVKPSIF